MSTISGLTIMSLLLAGNVTPVLADVSFVTDGHSLLNYYSFIAPDTSWRIDTGTEGEADFEAITPVFVGPADDGLSDTTGWEVAYEDSADDDYLRIPLGFSILYNGEEYTDVYIQSNSYISFGQGSDEYSDLNFDFPSIPAVHICSDDNSFQRVVYRQEEDGVRVRFEGTDSTGGTLDEPTMVYEAVFYPDQSYFDLHVGMNDRCAYAVLSPEVRGQAYNGFTLTGSTGTWDYEAGPFALTYQWLRSDDDGDTWEDIAGATDTTYTLTSDDVGYSIAFEVTGYDGVTETVVRSGWTDPVDEPYEIADCEDLMAMSDNVGTYVLTDDIDCNTTEVHPLFSESDFEGYFDGRGYTISNINMNEESDYVGLFAEFYYGTFTNVTLDNWYVHGQSYTGLIAGYAEGVTLTDITVDASTVASEGWYVGGLVGYGYVSYWPFIVDNVAVENTPITGWGETGGLIGTAYMDGGGPFQITDSSYAGDIASAAESDGDSFGGLIGYVYDGYDSLTIRRSFAMGYITTDTAIIEAVGGLIGYLYSDTDDAAEGVTIQDAYADMVITGGTFLGGLIGEMNGDGYAGYLNIRNTYATGSLTGANYLGGFFGGLGDIDESFEMTLTQSFAASVLTPDDGGYGAITGFTDEFNTGSPELLDVYFDSDLMGTDVCDPDETISACTSVNADGTAADFFFDTTNPPLSYWNFDGIWVAEDGDYPYFGLSDAVTPVVETVSVAGQSKTAVRVTGAITDEGVTIPTQIGFEYGTTTDYGSTVTESGIFSTEDFSLTLVGLSCGTRYHVRAFASSEAGTGYGEDMTFTTFGCGSAVYFPPVVTETSSGGSGSGSGSGSSGSSTPTTSHDDQDDAETVSVADPVFNSYTGHLEAQSSGMTGPSPFSGQVEDISAVGSGWYIRGENYDTVYFVDEDMIRHPFWDTQTFFTWGDSWGEVVWVTDATLATLSLGKPMLPKPGVVLVKIQGDARVYAIVPNADGEQVLREIPTEERAISFYGEHWADYVIDLEPTIFAKFVMGKAIVNGNDAPLVTPRTRLQLFTMSAE